MSTMVLGVSVVWVLASTIPFAAAVIGTVMLRWGFRDPVASAERMRARVAGIVCAAVFVVSAAIVGVGVAAWNTPPF